MYLKPWLGLAAIHAGQPSALLGGLRNAPNTVVLADTVIVTAVLLGLVALSGLVKRKSRRARDDS